MPPGTRRGGQAMRVLVTEDDEILATALAAGLRREGMAVDVTLDGAAALERLAVNRYDVVVLDRDLPGVHGDDVCRALASLDPARRVAVRAGRRLPLTTKELAVLECLLAADGRPVPAEELLERVWDEAADPFTTTVKTTIGRLRAKLGDPPVIQTVRESGYRIGEP
jgi:DNA-binding response OmpR family regulator